MELTSERLLTTVNKEVLWNSPESNFTASAQGAILYNEFEDFTVKHTVISPRDQ